jgi:hypothetical protein
MESGSAIAGDVSFKSGVLFSTSGDTLNLARARVSIVRPVIIAIIGMV